MSLFLTESEHAAIVAGRGRNPLRSFYWALINRVERRAASPGLMGIDDSADWWHAAAEYLTDAAMARAILGKPSQAVDAWLHDTTLAIARRPVADWVGPAFRDHETKPPQGHLETAHLSWGLAVVLDLATDLFSDGERDEISTALRDKGATLCMRWLDTHHHLANWRCVLNAGLAAVAAVLDDRSLLARAAAEFPRCVDVFQPDGSYGESLQYGNYAGFSLMIARESLTRRDPALAATLPLAPYALKPRWDAASLFYQKPLTGWGPYPRPRSANFNDSAALYRPSADFLLHIAARASESHPVEAGLARWLFDTLYTPCIEQPPHDLATFGFVNDFGFLTFPLLPQATAALSPEAAGLSPVEIFSCGDVLARDNWNGRTILAIHGAGDPLHGPGHLHGDLNSFILVHNQERLLVDPGHSCYRSLLHATESSSFTHNTCTFSVKAGSEQQSSGGLPQDPILQQSHSTRRRFDPQSGVSAPPVSRGGQRLLVAREGEVTVTASEIATLYGPPLTEFTRFWILCSSHVLFIVDRIRSSHPVSTSWSWLLNNRDGLLDLKLVRPDRLVARRGHAGMKLFHLGSGSVQEPLHAYVHDAYHPRPHQLGEGHSGSGLLVRWIEKVPTTDRTVIHAIAMDDPGTIAGWHLKQEEGYDAVVEAPNHKQRWMLSTNHSGLLLRNSAESNAPYLITCDPEGTWEMEKVCP